MKWKKEKRLRQIQEKKSKKEPFRTVSHVSHQLSEFSHSFQSCTDQMDTNEIKSKNDTKSKTGIPLRVAQKDVSLKNEYEFLNVNISTDNSYEIRGISNFGLPACKFRLPDSNWTS